MPFGQCFKVPDGSVQVNTIYRFAKLLAQYASLLTEVKLRPQTMVTQATLLAILYTVYGPIFTTALHSVFIRFLLQFARHSAGYTLKTIDAFTMGHT